MSERLPVWQPAGFWQRYLAYCIDALLLTLPIAWLVGTQLSAMLVHWQQLQTDVQEAVLDVVMKATILSPDALFSTLFYDAALRAAMTSQLTPIMTALTHALSVSLLLVAVYFVGFEASSWHATPGKRCLGLRVIGAQGHGVSVFRALLRHVAGALSWLSLNLGHALTGWRRDGRALHDLISGTRVMVSTTQAIMPRWGRWALSAQVVLILAILAWLAWRVTAAFAAYS